MRRIADAAPAPPAPRRERRIDLPAVHAYPRSQLDGLQAAQRQFEVGWIKTVMIKTPKPKDSKGWRDSYYHKLFGLKAANEAEKALTYFEEERPNDKRPREAIEAIRAWAEDRRTLGMKAVRKLSLDAHAAARDVKSDAAQYAAHAAGQAVGTWHAPAHALGAFGYAGRAFVAGKSKPSKP